MHRAGLVALVVFGTVLGANAQAYPTAKKRKVAANHNSYTLHNYGPRTAAAQPRAQAPRTYAEIDVAPAPTLQAATSPSEQYPTPLAVTGETYTQSHNPGPSQLPANRQGTTSQSIYSTGPNWGPFYNGGGYYNGGSFYNGFNNGGFYNGGGGFSNRGFNAGFNYGPGFQSNLVQQRFNPLPGEHPFSIQRPQMFPQAQYQNGGGFRGGGRGGNRCR